MHIHVLGICGTFMGGLAQLARAAGHRVTGCDANVYPPMSTQLTAAGIELVEGYGAEQLDFAPDVWVIGNAVTRGRPLMEAILDAGAPYVSGPQWLGEHLLRGRWVLGVAGTHGKTTTTAMLAWILERAGLAPSFLVGGVPVDFGVSARLAAGPHFVIEADEYDTAFFDKRSKFLHYRPRTLAINNLEFDHADIFPDLAAIETQFHHLVRTLPSRARIVHNGADPAIGRVLARGCWSERDPFGVTPGWSIGHAGTAGFEVRRDARVVGEVRWNLLGDHNQQNALAAIACAAHVGVDPAQACEALSAFGGVRRRMEVRGAVRGVTVYDDFAHHPTAIATTLRGLRRRVNAERIIAVLEPRSNTMKQGVMKDALAASLETADHVFCFSADLGWDAAQALAPLGPRVTCMADLSSLADAVVSEARTGDHVVVMSNGGFGGIHDRLLDGLAGATGAANAESGRG